MSNNQKRLRKIRPTISVSKEELTALINHHFRMANHYGKFSDGGSIEQRKSHQRKAKEYINMRDNYNWIR